MHGYVRTRCAETLLIEYDAPCAPKSSKLPALPNLLDKGRI